MDLALKVRVKGSLDWGRSEAWEGLCLGWALVTGRGKVNLRLHQSYPCLLLKECFAHKITCLVGKGFCCLELK